MDKNRKRQLLHKLVVLKVGDFRMFMTPETALEVHRRLGELLTDHAGDRGRPAEDGQRVRTFEGELRNDGFGFTTAADVTQAELLEFAKRCRT